MFKYLDEVPEDYFSDLHQIGSGSYSKIYSATYNKNKSKVALKISLKNKDIDHIKILEQETAIHKSLQHPFICKYFAKIDTEHLNIIVMELIEGINALEYLNRSKGLKVTEARNIFVQLVIAIEYLHNKHNIAHRDLKLENIMIDEYGHIRLVDFGFCSTKEVMTTICGSIPYCDPEVLKGQNYQKSADIWSMGVILYALVNQEFPFYDQDIMKMTEMICQTPVQFPNRTDPLLKDLLTKMLVKDSKQRFTIDDVKSHPFVTQDRLISIDFENLFSSCLFSSSFDECKIDDKDKLVQNGIKNSQSMKTIKRPNCFSNNLFLNNQKHKRRQIGNLLPSLNDKPQNNGRFVIIDDFDECMELQQNYPYNLNKEIEAALKLFQFPTNNQSIFFRKPFLDAPANRRRSHFNAFSKAKPIILPHCRNQQNIINTLFEQK